VMLIKNELQDLIKIVSEMDIKSSFVTNCFWASSQKKLLMN
jgi:hypothetical protein